MPRTSKRFPRYLAARLREALADTPAVLIHGPRQSGKTTLARTIGEPRGYRYVSFDDEAVQDAANATRSASWKRCLGERSSMKSSAFPRSLESFDSRSLLNEPIDR